MKKISTKKLSKIALGCLISTAVYAQENNILSTETSKDTLYMVPSGSLNFNTHFHLAENNSERGLNVENIGKENKANEQKFLIHEIVGNLGLEFGIPKGEEDEEVAKIFLNTFIKNDTLSINSFYAQYNQWTIGLTEGIFYGNNKAQVQFNNKINDHLAYALSIEQNVSAYNPEKLPNGTTNNEITYAKKMIPGIAGKLKFYGESGHIQMSGLVRPMEYHHAISEKDITLWGYGVKINGEWKVMPKALILKGSGLYGVGISSYLGVNASNDLVIDFNNLEESVLLPVIQASGTVEYQIIEEKLSSTLTGKMIIISDEENDKKRKDDDYSMGIQGTLGIKYHVNKQINLGLAYTHGIKKHVKDTKDDDAGAIKANVTYKF